MTDQDAAEQGATGWYVNSSGSVCRVVEVNSGYAILQIVSPKPSKYSMPIAEYDGDPGVPVGRRFVDIWHPAAATDLVPTGPTARPPRGIIPAPGDEPPEMSMMPDGE
jgi:hypothetical protein